MMHPAISVIIATYNRPRYLSMVLEGYIFQTFKDFEIIIADDGSGEETRKVINKYKKKSPFPIHHTWQEDKGFRKAKALNKAVVESSGELLVFSDSDCIPHPRLLEVYRNRFRKGSFMTGGVYNVNKETSEIILENKIVISNLLDLLDKGLVGFEREKIWHRNIKSVFYAYSGLRHPKIYGGNFAVGRRAFYQVNGFDENFVGWGQEDSDIRNRFLLKGVKPIPLLTNAKVYHLYHPDHPDIGAERMTESKNWRYYKREGVTARCKNGLIKDA